MKQTTISEQISLSRLAKVSSLDQNAQFEYEYLFSIRVGRMNEAECRNLRDLAFSLKATTKEEIQFRNSIYFRTTLRFKQFEMRKQRGFYDLDQKQPAKDIEKVDKTQPSLSSKLLGCLTFFMFSSPILATIKQVRPIEQYIQQDEEERILSNQSDEVNRKTK